MHFGRWIIVAGLVAVAAAMPQRLVRADAAAMQIIAWPGGWPFAAEATTETSADDTQAPADNRTLYVTGMVGSSFATDAGSTSLGGRLFTGEAAFGVSVPRPAGAVRLELEGRQRAALSGTRSRTDAGGEPVGTSIDGEWTTLANIWRDVAVTDHLGVYAGGGIGIGGYRQEITTASTPGSEPAIAEPSGSGRVTDFSWQVGGGATYAVTDRLTFDAGYRLYGVGVGSGSASGQPAGEVLFAVRIADPFRGWLRR